HALATDTQLKYRGIKETYRSIEAGSGFLVTPASKLVADVSRTTLAGNRWLQFTVGDVYSLSKRTQLYAWVRYQTAGGAAQQAAIWAIGPAGAGNRNQGMVMAGIHHGF
ncbi:MAG TPA: hypothetical protein VGU69_05145, partial [Rhizomicrobium sp.]|nr:hypothetical protein [Rhizomicrobium sp.]